MAMPGTFSNSYRSMMFHVLLLAWTFLLLSEEIETAPTNNGERVILNYDAGNHQHVQVGEPRMSVRGSYSRNDEHGVIRTTNYIADENGFRVEQSNAHGQQVEAQRHQLFFDFLHQQQPIQVKLLGFHPSFYFGDSSASFRSNEDNGGYRKEKSPYGLYNFRLALDGDQIDFGRDIIDGAANRPTNGVALGATFSGLGDSVENRKLIDLFMSKKKKKKDKTNRYKFCTTLPFTPFFLILGFGMFPGVCFEGKF